MFIDSVFSISFPSIHVLSALSSWWLQNEHLWLDLCLEFQICLEWSSIRSPFSNMDSFPPSKYVCSPMFGIVYNKCYNPSHSIFRPETWSLQISIVTLSRYFFFPSRYVHFFTEDFLLSVSSEWCLIRLKKVCQVVFNDWNT